jgi:hypothetical protein
MVWVTVTFRVEEIALAPVPYVTVTAAAPAATGVTVIVFPLRETLHTFSLVEATLSIVAPVIAVPFAVCTEAVTVALLAVVIDREKGVWVPPTPVPERTILSALASPKTVMRAVPVCFEPSGSVMVASTVTGVLTATALAVKVSVGEPVNELVVTADEPPVTFHSKVVFPV